MSEPLTAKLATATGLSPKLHFQGQRAARLSPTTTEVNGETRASWRSMRMGMDERIVPLISPSAVIRTPARPTTCINRRQAPHHLKPLERNRDSQPLVTNA